METNNDKFCSIDKFKGFLKSRGYILLTWKYLPQGGKEYKTIGEDEWKRYAEKAANIWHKKYKNRPFTPWNMEIKKITRTLFPDCILREATPWVLANPTIPDFIEKKLKYMFSKLSKILKVKTDNIISLNMKNNQGEFLRFSNIKGHINFEYHFEKWLIYQAMAIYDSTSPILDNVLVIINYPPSDNRSSERLYYFIPDDTLEEIGMRRKK